MATKTTTVWVCDRCEKEGEHYNTVGHKKIHFMVFQSFSDREICETCYGEFIEWFMCRKPKGEREGE